MGNTEVKQEETQNALSYEQLNNVASQLQQQAQALAMENQKLREVVRSTEFNELVTRLDLLIKIVKNRDYFENKDFCIKCEQAIIAAFADKSDVVETAEKQ